MLLYQSRRYRNRQSDRNTNMQSPNEDHYYLNYSEYTDPNRWIQSLLTCSNHKNELESDRRSLVDLFQQTEGKTSWRTKTHWCSENIPLHRWHKIKTNEFGVIRIDLTDNNLIGSITRLQAGALKQLQVLSLNQNNLYGPIPWTSILSLPSLKILDLSDNKFTGEIPWIELFHNLPSLKSLNLANNFLEGLFPLTLWESSPRQLCYIDIRQNNIQGSLSLLSVIYISNMRGSPMKYFDMRGNNRILVNDQFDRQYEICPYLRLQLSTLPHLRLSNCSIHGQLLPWTDIGFSKLRTIDFSWNSMEGCIPFKEIGESFPYLAKLNLSHNCFEGEITDDIQYLIQVKSLDLSSNKLYGRLSDHITMLLNLEFLDLHNNKFEGLFPKLTHFRNLREVIIDLNDFVGQEYETITQMGFFNYRIIRDLRWKETQSFVIFIHQFQRMSTIFMQTTKFEIVNSDEEDVEIAEVTPLTQDMNISSYDYEMVQVPLMPQVHPLEMLLKKLFSQDSINIHIAKYI